MKTRSEQLACMVARLPRRVPAWVTPAHVIVATSFEGLDPIERDDMRLRRVLLLCAVARSAVTRLRKVISTEG